MWDVVARIETESLRKLDKIVTKMRKLPEIEHTNTLINDHLTKVELGRITYKIDRKARRQPIIGVELRVGLLYSSVFI